MIINIISVSFAFNWIQHKFCPHPAIFPAGLFPPYLIDQHKKTR